MPNYLDSKKPLSKPAAKFVSSYKPLRYGRPASGGYGAYTYDGGSGGPAPHGHDFTPIRGGGPSAAGHSYGGGGGGGPSPSGYSYGPSAPGYSYGGGGPSAAGYSYGGGGGGPSAAGYSYGDGPDKYFGGDYQDGPSPTSSSSYSSAGPKSFVSVSKRLNEYGPDGAVINVDHGYGYDTDDRRGPSYPYRSPSASGALADDYESSSAADESDPGPSRGYRNPGGYHPAANDGDDDDDDHHKSDVYSRIRQSKSSPMPSSPYFPSVNGGAVAETGDDDYSEPSSTYAEWSKRNRDAGGVKQPAYWRMSYSRAV